MVDGSTARGGSLPFSEACERNKDPILDALRSWLPAATPAEPLALLEVGSGTGQHAVHIARHLPGIHWQTSERAGHGEGLCRRLQEEGQAALAPGARLLPPVRLDVRQPDWPSGPFGAVFSANTAHIMPAAAVPFLLAGSARVLVPGGLLLLYGPFRDGDVHNAPSNAAFDAHLRSLDPDMGVRDAAALAGEAETVGLQLVAMTPMPAHNRMLVFRRLGAGAASAVHRSALRPLTSRPSASSSSEPASMP